MRPTRLALSVAIALCLGACGGGDGPDATAQAASNMVQRMHALSAPAAGQASSASSLAAVGAKELFDWAEYKYPALFPKGSAAPDFPLSYQGVNYTVRAYANGNFLGMTEAGAVYGLGPFTGQVLTGFGLLADYAAQVQADTCSVYPGSCTPTPPTPSGPLNACGVPASEALALNNRYTLNYALTMTGATAASGEFTTEAVVDSTSASFEGQSAVRLAITQTNNITAAGQATTSTFKGKQYGQAAENGLIRNLGSESETSLSLMGTASITNAKMVFQPPYLNSEFTLAVGQSLTRTVSGQTTTSTSVMGTSLPPSTSSFTDTETVTYEERATVSVQGKSYDTCRYKETNAATPNTTTTTWYLVGRGVPVKILSVSPQATETTELKSGTYNGTPL